MLKGIDPRLSAEIVHVLMLMGHGDDLVVCDVNHPAATIARDTVYGEVVNLSGCAIPQALEAILSLMPIDDFVEVPVQRMLVVGDPEADRPIFGAVQAVVDRMAGRPITIGALERFAFYEAAQRAFAIVRTSDPGPYGCFILRKGVIDL